MKGVTDYCSATSRPASWSAGHDAVLRYDIAIRFGHLVLSATMPGFRLRSQAAAACSHELADTASADTLTSLRQAVAARIRRREGAVFLWHRFRT